eukprot:CAMPEP_0117506214 /NCGR_PEP_ID=MMETSP0784-20121206/25791_1 /TAXON_ID=39447 /ORGANISM="" /LENGTH=257 /DNA_ID=CAMNT_0005301677 /DNA_START=71 /DNA_END=845 /DNA_ORIENTATION=-
MPAVSCADSAAAHVLLPPQRLPSSPEGQRLRPPPGLRRSHSASSLDPPSCGSDCSTADTSEAEADAAASREKGPGPSALTKAAGTLQCTRLQNEGLELIQFPTVPTLRIGFRPPPGLSPSPYVATVLQDTIADFGFHDEIGAAARDPDGGDQAFDDSPRIVPLAEVDVRTPDSWRYNPGEVLRLEACADAAPPPPQVVLSLDTTIEVEPGLPGQPCVARLATTLAFAGLATSSTGAVAASAPLASIAISAARMPSSA